MGPGGSSLSHMAYRVTVEASPEGSTTMAVLETHGPHIVDPTDRLCILLERAQTLLFLGEMNQLVTMMREGVEIAIDLALAR